MSSTRFAFYESVNRKPIAVIVVLWLCLSLGGYGLYRSVAAGGVAFGRVPGWLAAMGLTSDESPAGLAANDVTSGNADAGRATDLPVRVFGATSSPQAGERDIAYEPMTPEAPAALVSRAPAADASAMSTRTGPALPTDAGDAPTDATAPIFDAGAPQPLAAPSARPTMDAGAPPPAPGWGSTDVTGGPGSTGITAGEAGSTGVSGGAFTSTGVSAGSAGSTGVTAGEAGSTGITGGSGSTGITAGASGSTGITGSRAP